MFHSCFFLKSFLGPCASWDIGIPQFCRCTKDRPLYKKPLLSFTPHHVRPMVGIVVRTHTFTSVHLDLELRKDGRGAFYEADRRKEGNRGRDEGKLC